VPLQADSGQALGVGYGTTAYNFNNQTLVNVQQLLIGETTAINTTAPPFLEIATTQTITANSAFVGVNIHDQTTLNNSNLGAGLAMFQVASTWTMTSVGSKGGITGVSLSPTFTGAASPAQLAGVVIDPSFNGTASLGTMYALELSSNVGSGATVSSWYGLAIGNSNSGTITTATGLDIGVALGLSGSTIWALRVGNYNSAFNGKTAFGQSGTPTWNIHLQGNPDSGAKALGIDVSTVGPTAPASNTSGTISFYKGSGGTNYYLLITFNDGGTTRYRYMQLNGTTATWTESTTIPT